MRVIRFVLMFLVLAFALFLSACAGGGSANTNPGGGGNQPPSQPPAPTASILASAASIIQGDSVILNWTSANATSCRASGSWSGDKALSGSETITPQAIGALTFGFTCQNSTGSVSVSVTVNVTAAQAPTIKITPSSVNMKIGETADFTIETTGLPNPPPNCSQPSVGSVQLLGFVLRYSADVKEPAALNTEFTCSVTNVAGTASVTVSISLSYPAPVVSSVVHLWIRGSELTAVFCYRNYPNYCFIELFAVRGSGFYPGGVLHAGIFGDLTIPKNFLTDENELILIAALDTPHYSPGDIEFSVSAPPDGPGGGSTSNVYKLPFITGQNSLARLTDGYALLDQLGGRVHLLDSGATEFDVFDLFHFGRNEGAIAVTNAVIFKDPENPDAGIQGDKILVAHPFNVTVYNSKPQPPFSRQIGSIAEFDSLRDKRPAVLATKGDWACVGEEYFQLLGCFDVSSGNGLMQITATGGPPLHSLQLLYLGMTDFPPDGRLVAVLLNTDGGRLTIFDVPSLQASRIIDLPDFIRGSQLPGFPRSNAGGADLAILEYDINLPGIPLLPVRVAAVISRFDKKVWFTDLAIGQVSGPFSLDGDAFRIVADNVNRNFVIALVNEDRAVGGTRFVKIDPAGTITVPTNEKVDILSIGLQVSPDGTTRVSCERAVCKSQPNN